MIRVLTRRQQIRSVAHRWRKQYGTTRLDVAERLDALDLETATRRDVDRAMGLGGWVDLSCDACGNDVDALVVVGQEPDYESATASICLCCAKAAAAALEAARD